MSRRTSRAAVAFVGVVLSLLVFESFAARRAGAQNAGGATDPPNLALASFVSGLSSPVGIVNARDGSGRVFVIEQAGRIRIIENGVLLSTPFLDISSRVAFGGERGLLGLAFPPNYS